MKNKSGCISTSSSVLVLPAPTILPLPTVTITDPSSCVSMDGSITVSDKADLYSFDNGENWGSSPIMNHLLPGNYFVKIKNVLTDCPSEPKEINLKLGSKLIAKSPQTFCTTQNATLKDIVINGVNLKWYDKNIGGNQLIDTTVLTQGKTYYATQTFGDCESLNRLAVTTNILSILPIDNFVASLCDTNNDGVEIVDLQDYNTNLTAIVSEYSFEYFSTLDGANNDLENKKILNFNNYSLQTGDNIIYVKAILNKECFRIVELKVTLITSENLKQSIYVMCENNSIIINAEPGFDDYQWSSNENTPSIIVSKAGTYWLKTIKKGTDLSCTTTTNFEVIASYKPIISKIITSEWTDNENTIEVLILNTDAKSNYEYSLDNINYQTSNKFWGLKSGTYKVYVKDKYNCGIVNQNIYLLMYPKFFTPNGDGFNDLWSVKNNENAINIRLKIFDRYGRFIKDMTSGDSGWDGKYNGEDLPSDDYWFVILIDNQLIKGHFSLKR
jgi:gliding motility-associated-like protein